MRWQDRSFRFSLIYICPWWHWKIQQFEQCGHDVDVTDYRGVASTQRNALGKSDQHRDIDQLSVDCMSMSEGAPLT